MKGTWYTRKADDSPFVWKVVLRFNKRYMIMQTQPTLRSSSFFSLLAKLLTHISFFRIARQVVFLFLTFFQYLFLRSYPAFVLGLYAFDSWMNANQWIHLKRCLSRIIMGLLRRTSKIDILTVNFQGLQLSSLKRLY